VRILLVNKFHYLRGGSETYYFDVAKGLRTLGHEIGFFSMQDERNVPSDQSSYFVSNSDYSGAGSALVKFRMASRLIYSKEALTKFEALLEDFHPDVVHLNLVHRQLTFSILDAPYLSQHKVPIVYTAHDHILICPSYLMLDGSGTYCERCLTGDFSNCLKRRCVKGSRAKSALATLEARSIKRRGSYRKIDRIIAPSEYLRTMLLKGGFPQSQLITMTNFASREVQQQAQRGLEKTCAPRAQRFLYVGRLSHEKGVDLLIRAFAQACSAGLSHTGTLFLAGDGQEREELECLARELGIEDRVSFLGMVPHEKMATLFAEAYVSVIPSRCPENMPYSVIESLAAGTPVIGSNRGGIPELVQDGTTGFVVDHDNVTHLAHALLRTSTLSTHQWQRLSQAGRRMVLMRCDQDRYMNQLVALYKQLIQEKKGR
jgi:glycosyltransferase involved in cell wall biosynthesis